MWQRHAASCLLPHATIGLSSWRVIACLSYCSCHGSVTRHAFCSSCSWRANISSSSRWRHVYRSRGVVFIWWPSQQAFEQRSIDVVWARHRCTDWLLHGVGRLCSFGCVNSTTGFGLLRELVSWRRTNAICAEAQAGPD